MSDAHPLSPLSSRTSVPFDLESLGSEWALQPASSSRRKHAIFLKPIEQSPNDRRSYRLVRLENGLEALLVSDPTLDKAAASLSVGVGHLNDPDDLPGLAHFLEHMLFLGTEKFPDEAAYKTFLSQHAGSSNAYTSLDETNYHFTVHPSSLAGALARHAQFFVAPLFLASCTERELNAVDSEFRRNLMLDSRRLFQLGKATSSREEGARYWKFGTGSRQTLWDEPVAKGVDVRERLLDWYRTNYSANLMRLVVLSTQSLDEMTELTLEHYAAIVNSNLPPPTFNVPAIGPKEYQTLVSYRTIKDRPQLRLEFPLRDQSALWRTQPGRYISHLIGHEGPGSVLSVLKEHGWANSLSSGGGGGALGFEFFRVDVELTATGLENYRTVLEVIFAYIKLIKSTGVVQWIFEETKSLSEIAWRWKEQGQPASVVQDLSSRLHDSLPSEKVLVGKRIATDFDAGMIKSCLEELSEDRCRVLLGSQEPPPGTEWDKKEQYYSTEYMITKLGPISTDVHPGLHLPTPNPFIPTKLDLGTQDPNARRPALIRQTPTSRLFFKKDDTWLIPRARAQLLLKSPRAQPTPVAAVQTQLLADLIEEELSDSTYDAQLAGLYFAVGTDPSGLEIVVSGYSEKLPVLLKVILDKLKSLAFNPTRFSIVHERLRRGYANAALENPSTTAERNLKHLLSKTHWTCDERLHSLDGLTLGLLVTHARELLEGLSIEGLVHGNVLRSDAIEMIELTERTLETSDSAKENDSLRSLVIPEGSTLVYRPLVVSPENVNSSATVYYQVCHSSDRELHARLYLFAQCAKVSVFSTLRTKEQLGYIVQSGTRLSRGMAGFKVIVQSERIAEYLDERIEALWAGFGAVLDEMSDQDFVEQRQSLVDQRLEKPKNLGQETSRYWTEIECEELDFFHREREAEMISTLTKADIVAFFKTYILPSPSRTKLAILMRSQRLQPAALVALGTSLSESLPAEAAKEAQSLLASKPTREAIDSFVAAKFGEQVPDSVQKELKGLAELPVLPEGTKEVLDGEEFRMSLDASDPALPVDDFLSDLSAHL